MLQTTHNTKNGSTSKFLGNRRRRFLNMGNRDIGVFPIFNMNFLRSNQGSVFHRVFDGTIHRMKFYSSDTGRSAFGYGANGKQAYNAMKRNFNKKYNCHA